MKEKQKNNYNKILIPVKNKINLSMFLSCISTLCYISTLMLMAYLIKTLTTASYEPKQVYSILGAMLIVIIISFYTRNKSSLVSHMASYELEYILRKELSDKATRMSQADLNKSGTGGIVSILQDQVANLHGYVADSPPIKAKAYCSPIVTLIVIFALDWRLALVDLVVLAIGMFCMAKSMSGRDEIMIEYQNDLKEINESIVEYIQAMPIIRTFDGGTSSFSRYQSSLDKFKKNMMEWQESRVMYTKLGLAIFNPLVTIFVLTWAGFYFWSGNTLSFNTWLGFLLFGAGVIDSIMNFMFLSRSVYLAQASAEIIINFKDTPELKISDSPKVPNGNNVVFENVYFNYSDDAIPTLEDINFEVLENSFVAIVGTSGAGKSTIARLIPRFWEISSGSIKIGGVDIREMAPAVLMDKISIVFQENYLFNESIENNIKLGMPNATHEDVVAAAKLAQAHEFIEKLPKGYKTIVGERGSKLSGGQKQRIAIARALLQNRPILILDEATAHADTENEALLLKALSNLIKNKTVIMITHRLTTIQDADNIIVLDKGHLADQGKHSDLIENSEGVYNKLWQIQLATQSWVMSNKQEEDK